MHMGDVWRIIQALGLCTVLLATASARAEVIYYENFESGWGEWTTDYGVWQVGVPTSGPGDAHSGTNVAATVLAGDYPLQTDSRLISPAFDLPTVAGAERLELRFWQWFSYNGYNNSDKGYVQISVWNGSAWGGWSTLATPVDAHSPSYNYPTYNSGWSKCAVELTAYAGQTVRLAFYHVAAQTDSYNGSGSGWTLDDVEVWKGVPQMPAREDFESGWGDWYADHGVWQIATNSGAPSGTNVVTTVAYPSQTDSRLISPAFDLPTVAGAERLELRFWQWFSYNGYNNSDKGYVQISVWNGSAWGGWSTLATPVDAHSPSYNYPTYNSGWSKCAVELTAYAGQTVRLAFYHVAAQTDSYNGSSSGWTLDDVEVWKGVPQMPALEDFESGWGDWYADHGVWQIVTISGAPSGTNAVTTVAYPSQTDSRLISPAFDLPTVAGAERLELRFWQWFSYNGYDSSDKGYVQISVWNGAAWGGWSTLATPVDAHSPSYNYPIYNSGWSKCAVDLTAYAGQTVRLAFYHVAAQTDSYNGSSSGWYLDDVEVWKGVPQMPALEDFESGWGDWYADDGVWQIGAPSGGGTISGSNVAATYLSGNYPDQTDSRLISPPFLVPPAERNPEVRFWQWYSYGALDNGHVQISEWTGTNWTAWVTLATPAPESSSSDWSPSRVALAPYGGRVVRVSFYHTAARTTSGNGSSAGWHIDDVEITPKFFSVALGSAITRTGEEACVSVNIATVSSVTNFNFTLAIPAGHVPSVSPDFDSRFASVTVIPGIGPDGSSRWTFNLTTSATNALYGGELIGSICFTPNSVRSAFVPMTIEDVFVAQYPNWIVSGIGNLSVFIANEPLLSWVGSLMNSSFSYMASRIPPTKYFRPPI